MPTSSLSPLAADAPIALCVGHPCAMIPNPSASIHAPSVPVPLTVRLPTLLATVMRAQALMHLRQQLLLELDIALKTIRAAPFATPCPPLPRDSPPSALQNVCARPNCPAGRLLLPIPGLPATTANAVALSSSILHNCSTDIHAAAAVASADAPAPDSNARNRTPSANSPCHSHQRCKSEA